MATLRIADSVGRVLGDRYRLTHPLGTGASAHVYVADDVTLRRRVAIKLLHPGLADDEAFLRRFRAEARAIAPLRHPNILRVYDWGEDEGSPYIVTELLEGGSLRALLDRGHLLTPSQGTAVAFAAAEALDHAHRHGLVHRDIKPANLLFDEEGRVSVADFGLARALAEATWTEPAGAILGTARYAAPEQVRGKALGPRADVYALALVVTEATTGIVPFATDTTFATLMARLEGPLRVPPGAGPLAPVLEAAGTVDPEQRLDAAGLVRALEALAATLPPPAPLPLAGPFAERAIERDDHPTAMRSRITGTVRPAPEPEPPSVLLDRSTLPDWGAPVDPPGDTAPPAEAPPFEDTVPPFEDTVPPSEDTVPPFEDTVPPFEDTVPPSEETVPFQDAVPPFEDTVPFEETVPPGAAVAAPVTDDPAAGAPGDDDASRRPVVIERRLWPQAAAAVLVVLLLAAGGGLGWALTHRPLPLETVPTLRGRTEQQAAATLTRHHLVLTVAGRGYDAAPKGTITGQTPTGGRLREHQAVAVTVSLGPQPVRVPALADVNQADATRLLQAVGLAVGRVSTTTSITVPSGDVIRSTPSSGTLPPGSRVALVVSTGKPTVTVPLLQGSDVLSYTNAAAALRAANLAPTEELAYSNVVAAGEVITTNPAPNSDALYGSSVIVVVSKGPNLVVVPDLRGRSVASADATLAADGFVVTGVTGNPGGKVQATDPAAGQSVLEGSSIQIVTGH